MCLLDYYSCQKTILINRGRQIQSAIMPEIFHLEPEFFCLLKKMFWILEKVLLLLKMGFCLSLPINVMNFLPHTSLLTLIIKISPTRHLNVYSGTSHRCVPFFSMRPFVFHFCGPCRMVTSKTSPGHSRAKPAMPEKEHI